MVSIGGRKMMNPQPSTIIPALHELTSDISSGSNGAVGPDTVLVEKVFTEPMKSEEMLSDNPGLPGNSEIGMNIGILQFNLQAALSALKKKEKDLKSAEMRLLHEQANLGQVKQDLEHQQQEISATKQKQIEEDLETANHNLASKGRQIEDLKLFVRDQNEKIAASQSSLSLKEEEMCKLRDELKKKNEEAEVVNSELEWTKQLLDEATEVVRKQEEKLEELQKEVEEKEHNLAASFHLIKLEKEWLNLRRLSWKSRLLGGYQQIKN